MLGRSRRRLPGPTADLFVAVLLAHDGMLLTIDKETASTKQTAGNERRSRFVAPQTQQSSEQPIDCPYALYNPPRQAVCYWSRRHRSERPSRRFLVGRCVDDTKSHKGGHNESPVLPRGIENIRITLSTLWRLVTHSRRVDLERSPRRPRSRHRHVDTLRSVSSTSI
jgi:hypothetical protein